MKEKYLFDYLAPTTVNPAVPEPAAVRQQTVQNTSLAELAQTVVQCRRCPLRAGASQVVFGTGNTQAQLLLVGEGPGAEEDAQGLPFVGAAGKLLTKILASVDISREEVYITNVVKCRPPGNRAPSAKEIETCLPHLLAQIELLNPQIILCLGAVATKALIDPQASVSLIRGKWLERKGRKIMATFHPAALLRDQSKKRPVWYDIQKVRDVYRSLSQGGD
ncbi:MAG: uracil-DNA glycosylase [Dethiobacteraceae bacterium]|jgi:uracil-DNA glycosylase family 4|nr:uracil-DNA glycosylase [Bacillota bacterium]